MDQSEDNCTLCREPLHFASVPEHPSSPLILRCTHTFHRNCIRQIVASSGTCAACPLCGVSIGTSDYLQVGYWREFRHLPPSFASVVRVMFSTGFTMTEVVGTVLEVTETREDNVRFSRLLQIDDAYLISSEQERLNWARDVVSHFQRSVAARKRQIDLLYAETEAFINDVDSEYARHLNVSGDESANVILAYFRLIRLAERLGDLYMENKEAIQAAVIVTEFIFTHENGFSDVLDLTVDLDCSVDDSGSSGFNQLNIALHKLYDCRTLLNLLQNAESYE